MLCSQSEALDVLFCDLSTFAMYHSAVSGLRMYTVAFPRLFLVAAINRQLTFHSSTTSPSLAEWTKAKRANIGSRGDKDEEDEGNVNNY